MASKFTVNIVNAAVPKFDGLKSGFSTTRTNNVFVRLDIALF